MAHLSDVENMKRLANIKYKERFAICAELSREPYFFQDDWIELGKHFLEKFIGDKIWRLSFEEVQQILESEHIKVPKPNLKGVQSRIDASGTLTITWDSKHDDESEFYKGLLQAFLSLNTLPKDCLTNLKNDANGLMQELIVHKKTCNDKIESFKGRKLSSEEIYELKRFKFYKERIENVIKRLRLYIDNEMKNEALALSTSSTWSITKLMSIGAMVKATNPTAMSDITNKFMHCTIPKLKQLQHIYNKRPISFYRLSECWILKRAVPETEKLIKGNHWFQGRDRIVLRAFKFFKQKEYQLSTAILALQIEGLIRDALLALGVDADDISAKPSISSKAAMLYDKNVGFYSYEYYRFRFPLLRNKIAHGDAHKTQREDAIFTVLDFCAICKDIALNDKIPVNSIVKILKSLDIKNPDFATLLNYADLCVKNPQLKVPEFYNLSAIEAFARETIRGNAFWDWMIENPEKNYMSLDEIMALGQSIGIAFDAKDQAQRHNDECLKIIAKRDEDIARIKAFLRQS